MGLYTQVQFEYIAGNNAKAIDPERLGVMMDAILKQFCTAGLWDTADKVNVYIDIDDTAYHWNCVLKGKENKTLMVIGALQRNKRDKVEFHS